VVVYDDQAVNELAFAETCRHLVDRLGYPPVIADLEYDNGAISRGLVADPVHGNLVKLDWQSRVTRAFHGDNPLALQEVTSIYGNPPRLPLGNGCHDILSPFDLPAGRLYSLVVGALDDDRDANRSYGAVLADIVAMLDFTHTRGDLKARIVADPGRFVERRPAVAAAVRRIRESGKRVFLLTNSGYDYTSEVLDYVFAQSLDGSWRSLFDAVVVEADKPSFFYDPDRNLLETADSSTDSGTTLHRGGGAARLEETLGVRAKDIMFVGDNPTADCVAARSHGWRTATVVPELKYDPIDPGSHPDSGPLRTNRWGSLFWEDGTPTRFTRVLTECADVYVERVEPILEIDSNAVLRGR